MNQPVSVQAAAVSQLYDLSNNMMFHTNTVLYGLYQSVQYLYGVVVACTLLVCCCCCCTVLVVCCCCSPLSISNQYAVVAACTLLVCCCCSLYSISSMLLHSISMLWLQFSQYQQYVVVAVCTLLVVYCCCSPHSISNQYAVVAACRVLVCCCCSLYSISSMLLLQPAQYQ